MEQTGISGPYPGIWAGLPDVEMKRPGFPGPPRWPIRTIHLRLTDYPHYPYGGAVVKMKNLRAEKGGYILRVQYRRAGQGEDSP